LLYSVKKYRLNFDRSEKKSHEVYKMHYRTRILIRKQLQKLYLYVLNLNRPHRKKAFDARFLFIKTKNYIKVFDLFFYVILVRILFVPTPFDAINLIRNKYVTINGIINCNPYCILNTTNIIIIIPYLFQRLLYFY